MQEKTLINPCGIARMMVVMIHSTSWYITHPHAITLLQMGHRQPAQFRLPRRVPLLFMVWLLSFWGNAVPSRAISGGLPVHCVL